MRRLTIILIGILFLTPIFGDAILELQRIEITNDYVYNRPIITSVYRNIGDNATTIINQSLDISKAYILTSQIPDFIEAGDTWILTYSVDELKCSDYNSNINYNVNVSYTTTSGDKTISNSSSFTVLRPLEIVNENPDPSEGFNILLEESQTFLFDVFNNGTVQISFNFSKAIEPTNLYLIFRDHIQKYQLSDFENTTFVLGGKDRLSFEVDIVPTGIANNLVEFTINYDEVCTAMSNQLDFYVSVKTKADNVIDLVFADGIGVFQILAVLLLSSIYLWRS